MNTSVGSGCLAIPNDVAAGFWATINATVAEVGEFVALGVRVAMVLFQCWDNSSAFGKDSLNLGRAAAEHLLPYYNRGLNYHRTLYTQIFVTMQVALCFVSGLNAAVYSRMIDNTHIKEVLLAMRDFWSRGFDGKCSSAEDSHLQNLLSKP